MVRIVRKPYFIGVKLSPIQYQHLLFLATVWEETISETVRKCIEFCYILFNPNLSFIDAIRPIHELAEKLGEKIDVKPPTKLPHQTKKKIK